MSSYHSTKRINQWRSYADQGDFVSLVHSLLRYHYDPLYEKSRNPVMQEAAKHNLLHRIHLPAVDAYTVRSTVIPQLLDLAQCTHQKRHWNSSG
ncbi:hypothetical protein FBUS_10804 [Fasciolopsis buskii]|uniref:Uncharacterized protein n=1 Tax=Fasciolopsis buskii TaxID=27845 RepID=A0A8E0VL41_9TREM|nr:hypothetical protein FBUS_10804 [Fasciolopsis buski]